ncbi:MAG TPA: histidine kinase dimerization/phospho-acceptor domain-containing protein [Streptosporangiaceae bacterium]|nr:histidine kinase dimerization/phospho-acceptor domain-containing protein [Streptosporangiaceae bacterium]
MTGPADELKDLADTIDGLLGRLQAAFDAQRQFVANASHELRTPLTLTRTLLQLTLTDPRPTLDGFRATCEDVLAAGDQQEQLIEALLTLARASAASTAGNRPTSRPSPGTSCAPATRTPQNAAWPSAPRSARRPSWATRACSSGWPRT